MAYETKVEIAHLHRKRQPFALSLKTLEESGVFAGYASVFSLVDSQNDMILPGAFTRSLIGRTRDIKLLWQHDMGEPIGVIEELREDENGLYIKGRLLLDVARAREAYALLREGILSGLSIGYSPVDSAYDDSSGVRLLKEIDLWEVSLVTFPANRAARITVVKGESRPPSRSEILEKLALIAALDQATAILKGQITA